MPKNKHNKRRQNKKLKLEVLRRPSSSSPNNDTFGISESTPYTPQDTKDPRLNDTLKQLAKGDITIDRYHNDPEKYFNLVLAMSDSDVTDGYVDHNKIYLGRQSKPKDIALILF